ncbi:MAG: GIY-YIG nuclease family protein [Candidatus Liptonbacteria bacterium]
MFSVYILKSQSTGRYYVGSCSNLETRMKQHNSELVKSTKGFIPWQLVHVENYDNLKAARLRELQIKSWKKRSSIERLLSQK